jgi:hypothetical protein
VSPPKNEGPRLDNQGANEKPDTNQPKRNTSRTWQTRFDALGFWEKAARGKAQPVRLLDEGRWVA